MTAARMPEVTAAAAGTWLCATRGGSEAREDSCHDWHPLLHLDVLSYRHKRWGDTTHRGWMTRDDCRGATGCSQVTINMRRSGLETQGVRITHERRMEGVCFDEPCLRVAQW